MSGFFHFSDIYDFYHFVCGKGDGGECYECQVSVVDPGHVVSLGHQGNGLGRCPVVPHTAGPQRRLFGRVNSWARKAVAQ